MHRFNPIQQVRSLARLHTRLQAYATTHGSLPNILEPHTQALFQSTDAANVFLNMVSDTSVIDVTFDVGRPVVLHFNSNDPCLPMDSRLITKEDVTTIWKTFAKDITADRAVIHNTPHRVSCLRDFDGSISGLTLRLAHTPPDIHMISDEFKTYLALGYSTLLFGPPGSGKTTMLRAISTFLADYVHRRVIVVDEFGELVPTEHGNARRMCVHPNTTHADAVLSAIRNHTPGALIVDELMTSQDVASAMTASQRGIQLIATAHGDSLEHIVRNPVFRDMLGGVQHAAVSDAMMHSKGGGKFVRARTNAPVFRGGYDVRKNTLYTNLSTSVDQIYEQL